jgi:O-antigen/teichoic acid export membrane protein
MPRSDTALERGASSSAEALATAASEPPPAGSSRTGTALKGGLALGLHRGLLLAVSLVMVPLAAHTLPRAEFGAWLLLSTIPALIGFLDLGLANGLVTIVATESPRGDEGRRNIHRYVSSAAFLLLGVGVTLAAALAVVVSVIDLRAVMGASHAISRAEFATGLVVLVVATALLIPLSVGQRLAQGLQRMHLVGVTGAIGMSVQLAVAVGCTVLGAGFGWWVFASSLGSLLAGALAWFVVFHRIAPDLRPSWHLVDRAAARVVLRRGSLFLVIGIAAAVGFQTDALVIASRLGVESVPEYAAPYRLFSLVTGVVTLFALPLWAAHADAFARDEHDWTRRTFRRSMIGAGVVATLATAAIVLTARPILSLTLGSADPNPSFGILLALAATAIVISLSQPLGVLLNAANVVKFQVVIGTLMCVLNLGLSLVLVETIGVAGPPLATAISQTVLGVIPCAIYVRRMERKHDLSVAKPATAPVHQLAP